MDDNQSKGGSSGGQLAESVSSAKKSKKAVDNGGVGNETLKELKREKQLRKVLKEELKKQYERVAELEKDFEKARTQVVELETELRDKDTKFLDLYHENTSQHDKILELTNRLEAERESLAQVIQEGEVINPKRAKKLKQAQSQIIQQQQSSITNEDSMTEFIVAYEKRIAEMLMTVQKQERDILYKDEEIKSIKNIARDCAQELELVKQQEGQFRAVIKQRDETIAAEQLDKDSLGEQIKHLKDILSQESKQNNQLTDMKLEWEAVIDRKDTHIHQLKEEVVKYRDEVKGKDEAIKALSMTLIDKGKQNQRLTEMVVEIKNHHLMTQILGQKFHVQKLGTIKNDDYIFRFILDKSRTEEYFLEICDSKGKPLRQIAVNDIQDIDPIQGTRFALCYNAAPLGSNLPFVGGLVGNLALRAQGVTLKEEEYVSKHIAELRDAFEQIIGLMENDQRELDKMIEDEDLQMRSHSSSGGGSGNADLMEQFDHELGLKQHVNDDEDASTTTSTKNY